MSEANLEPGRDQASPPLANGPRDTLPGEWILSTRVNALGWDQALNLVLDWARTRQSRYVCVCNVHMVVEAARSSRVAKVVSGGDLIVPDGMPLVWLLRKMGHPRQPRISGPDFFLELCREAQRAERRVFLLGGAPETLEALKARLVQDFPDLMIVGSHSPSYGPIINEPDMEAVRVIEAAQAEIVFVSLGCPKQESWMAVHKPHVKAVMLGVGAAFDFAAGNLSRAPQWMQRSGLEWLYRLLSEPRRLWRRYLVTNSVFLTRITEQWIRRRLWRRPGLKAK